MSPPAEITPHYHEVVSIHLHMSTTADSKKVYSDWSVIGAPASMSMDQYLNIDPYIYLLRQAEEVFCSIQPQHAPLHLDHLVSTLLHTSKFMKRLMEKILNGMVMQLSYLTTC